MLNMGDLCIKFYLLIESFIFMHGQQKIEINDLGKFFII